MSKDIIVKYSGRIRIEPQNIKFQYIGQNDHLPEIIDGVQWQALSEDDRSDYIIEDAIAAMLMQFGEWDHLEFFTNEEMV